MKQGKMTVCQTCGDKGEARLLIYCIECHDSAVHHYCLDKFSPDDDNITWKCEECDPKVAKVGLSRKSERISERKDQAWNVRLNWKWRLNKNSSSTAHPVYTKDRMAETAELTKDHSLPSLAPYCNYVPIDILCSQPSLEPDNSVSAAQPIIDPIWRGMFTISNGKSENLGITAHLSTKACQKVFDAATTLPLVLDIEVLPRCDAWPKSFQRSPPTDDSIALFLFPEYERDEKVFDALLDDINERNLALKTTINDVDLLIFSSLELPMEHWRFRRKYYLWGVFREKQRSMVVLPTYSPVTENIRVSKHANQAKSLDVKCIAESMSLRDPHSPLSTSSSHVSNTSKSQLVPYSRSSSSDTLSSHSSKCFRLDKTKKECDLRLRPKIWRGRQNEDREKAFDAVKH